MLPDDVVQEWILEAGDDPKEGAEWFLWWHQDWFLGADLRGSLQAVRRPLRELMVTHQAWGIIRSNGFNNYLRQFDERFDAEVRRGLSLLGRPTPYEALAKARALFQSKPHEGVTLEESGPLFSAFYGQLEDFEELLGRFLIQWARAGGKLADPSAE